ncbi:MAG: oxalate:formate antiporter [Oscillospiraceae bacterium]|nr:oxalate:formate antiporter [Oscillospiraceae bacterium]
MRQVTRIIPCYAADTSGVCSALYELGGMIAVHDASGVNSTYATHDEPRWEQNHAMIYVSGLTELDAILGNDEKYIADVVSAAADQNPAFLAVCGSPMPMMIGVDFDAVAAEIEQRSGIRTFALHTNGMHSYIEGAAEALLAIAEEYVQPASQKIRNGVNILGATPLDSGNMQQIQSIRAWLAENGFSVVSCFAMGDDLQTLGRAAEAAVSLVISQTGLAAAQYFSQRFGIPYVCGVPVGLQFSAQLADALRCAADTGESAYPCAFRSGSGAKTVLIGESISAGSLAAALGMDGTPASVICPLPHDEKSLGAADSGAASEQDIADVLAQMQPETVIADPLYRFILPENARLIELPHYAFSGRCFETKMPDLTAGRFGTWLREVQA